MTKLPAANEFSPGQLDGPGALIELLEVIESHGGNRSQVIEWIRQRWFANAAAARVDDPQGRLEQQVKRSQNVVSGMRQYGLLTPSADPLILTDLAIELSGMSAEPDKLFARFAQYLLRDKEGLALLEAASAVLARKPSVSRDDIAQELTARGFTLPTNTSYPSKLRQWLEAAHVVDYQWNVNQIELTSLIGVASSDVATWRNLTDGQRAVVEILRSRSAGNRTPLQSSDLLDLLRQRGVLFDEAQVKRKIYDPLISKGLISQIVKTGGRGGKGGLITLTDYGVCIDTSLIDQLNLGSVAPELQGHLGRSTESILIDLDSENAGTKGIALELLALRMSADLGLMPAEMRLRSADTGGAEVDLVAEGAHLHFSRWLFQCKNQVASVGLSVLAKEIGMATLLKAQIVAIVTTGTFAKTVRDYAQQASEATAIQVILIDQDSLKNYRAKGPAGLRHELHQSSVATLAMKRPQLARVPREGSRSDVPSEIVV